jgi:RPA family protein
MSGDDGDGGPGRRETAHRAFAAEFDDVSVSYRESDEERAPNYVVLPTGARVNRAFAVGVLTEVEPVNDQVVRARIADPTGVFVSYAGQYQPEALAFFERTDPPEFVAITGKARTFEPEDGDRVFSSLRPESVNAVDADTRDRWVVDAARATLRRVAVTSDALSREARGDDLRAELAADGVPEALAAGVPMAVDRYGTTEAYLEDVRRMAVEALELVADERETVTGLSLAPGEGGAAAVGPTLDGPVADAPPEPDAETVEPDTESSAREPDAETVEADPAPEPDTTTEPDTESSAREPDGSDGPGDFDAGEFDDDGLYEMDDEERAEAASFGTEFETGTEVDPAGEAGIDVPDEPPEPESEPEPGEADGADGAVDLEDAVVAAMQDLDDGSGADREAVVSRVVDDHGADPDAVEDAVQDALMSGRCYEPDEATLKPI